MRAILTCCWPGLTRLWYRGEWVGLATATLFAALFNLAILARFVWPELLSAKLASAIWILVGVWWSVGLVRSLGRFSRSSDHSASGSAEERFTEAQTEYLCGHWFEAEALLRQILLENARDLESHLLLASLLRHTGRLDESIAQLDTLERLDGSSKWWLEIQQERSRLRQAGDELAARNLPENDLDVPFSGDHLDSVDLEKDSNDDSNDDDEQREAA